MTCDCITDISSYLIEAADKNNAVVRPYALAACMNVCMRVYTLTYNDDIHTYMTYLHSMLRNNGISPGSP